MPVPPRPPTLHLNDPVHVVADGRIVPVRRKGLAMLAFLALEGPTRRERLADVLWGRRRALPNLRVELHRLRHAFEPTSLDPVARAANALSLAPQLEVAVPVPGDGLLAGLDDVSAPFQEWLDHRRSLADTRRGHAVRTGLLAELAARVAPPFVLVLEGAPGSGRRGLARDLARRLELPWSEDPADGRAALHYVAPDQQHDGHVVDRILHDSNGVWVLGRSPFAEDTKLLLRLRAKAAPERMRFVALEPISWPDARASLPDDVGFREGARLYLTAGGNPGYLSELVKLRSLRGPNGGDAQPVAVPQRLRAAVLLEADRLTFAARRALERLSVHTGSFTAALLAALDVEPVAEELERMGWLRYDGSEWTFTDPIAARLVRVGVQPGVRLHVHHRIADHLEREGSLDRAAFHRRAAHGDPGAPPSQTADPVAATGPLPYATARPGRPVWLEERGATGHHVTLDAGRSVWSSLVNDAGPGQVTWGLPAGPVLVRLRGRAYAQPDEAGTLPASLLHVKVQGASGPELRLGVAIPSGIGGDGALHVRLPLGEPFECWISVPSARTMTLTATRANAVIESEVDAFEIASDGEAGRVDAIDLAPRRAPLHEDADPDASSEPSTPAPPPPTAN